MCLFSAVTQTTGNSPVDLEKLEEEGLHARGSTHHSYSTFLAQGQESLKGLWHLTLIFLLKGFLEEKQNQILIK